MKLKDLTRKELLIAFVHCTDLQGWSQKRRWRAQTSKMTKAQLVTFLERTIHPVAIPEEYPTRIDPERKQPPKQTEKAAKEELHWVARFRRAVLEGKYNQMAADQAVAAYARIKNFADMADAERALTLRIQGDKE